MPVMSSIESAFCRSAAWELFARRTVLPVALDGHQLTGDVLEIGGGVGAMADGVARRFPTARLTVTDIDDADMVVAARAPPSSTSTSCSTTSPPTGPPQYTWLLRHKGFHFHFTPTYGSWINLVERWFSALTTKKLQRSAHRSVKALAADIRDWVEHWNENPKPFTWHKSADDILDRLAGYCAAINKWPALQPDRH